MLTKIRAEHIRVNQLVIVSINKKDCYEGSHPKFKQIGIEKRRENEYLGDSFSHHC